MSLPDSVTVAVLLGPQFDSLLTLYLYVVVKQNNDTEERAGEAYANFLLTEQGQKLLEQAGCVPIF